MFQLLKEILAPKKCYGCQKYGSYLCQTCKEQIGFFEPICYICKQKSPYFETHWYCQKHAFALDRVYIAHHYRHKPIQKMIKDMKYYKKYDLIDEMTLSMSNTFNHHFSDAVEDCVLIPTPMYFWKRIFRWYNQSEELVKNLSKILNIQYELSLVKKIRSSRPQSHLSKMERYENIKNKFEINKNLISSMRYKTIIIVDDVVSTGATLNEIAKVLKNAGFEKIYALVFASD